MFKRKSSRLEGYDYASSGMYYVTICTKDNRYLFGEVRKGRVWLSEEGRVVRDCWENIPEHFEHVSIDDFVVMPNHMHGIVVIKNAGARHASPVRSCSIASGSLGAVIGSFKSAATKRVNDLRGMPGGEVWHRNYYDHIIRNENDLNRIREYIRNNPMNWAHDKYR